MPEPPAGDEDTTATGAPAAAAPLRCFTAMNNIQRSHLEENTVRAGDCTVSASVLMVDPARTAHFISAAVPPGPDQMLTLQGGAGGRTVRCSGQAAPGTAIPLIPLTPGTDKCANGTNGSCVEGDFKVTPDSWSAGSRLTRAVVGSTPAALTPAAGSAAALLTLNERDGAPDGDTGGGA